MSGKITHRLAAAGICALVAAGSCTTAAAFGHSYYLPEVSSMNITVPGDLITITRDASEGDSYFTTFHQDYAATMQDLQTNNIYLQGMDSDASLTVTVTMIETADSRNVGDYNQLSSEQLSEIAKNFLKDPAYTACRVDKSGKEVNWLQFDTAINGAKGLLANTVVEGRSINVSMNRNGSDVTEEDGKAFNSMISGVAFGERNFFDRYGMMILVAIAAILVVAVIAMIIIRIVRSRGSEKPTIHDENEKILEELAGKYARKPIVPVEETEQAQSPAEEPQPDETPEPESVNEEAESVEEETYEEEAPAQTQEGELLGAEDIEDFIFDDAGVLPAEEEAPIENEAAPAEDAENDDFFAGSELTSGEAYEAIETETPVKVVEEVPVEEVPVEETPVEEAPVEEAPVDEEPVEEEPTEEEPTEEEPAEEESEPDEFEEYMNDEVLVRQNVKSNKFKNSSDFFDEAPRKSVGVISSRDLEEAEEYDVIGEEEKRAEEVKREEPKKKAKKKKDGSSVKAFFLGFLMGCKSFFTHCGYFITNVSRAIKRSHAKKKRKKAEEERRRRARERAAQQRAQSRNREQQREKQRTSGGLVQVRSRGDRRPQSGTQRRPQGSTQRRPQSSTQRRPQSGTQRRPASGRPPQKRRPSSSTTARRR